MQGGAPPSKGPRKDQAEMSLFPKEGDRFGPLLPLSRKCLTDRQPGTVEPDHLQRSQYLQVDFRSPLDLLMIWVHRQNETLQGRTYLLRQSKTRGLRWRRSARRPHRRARDATSKERHTREQPSNARTSRDGPHCAFVAQLERPPLNRATGPMSCSLIISAHYGGQSIAMASGAT